MPSGPSPPRGNALFIILVAVALFAALSYAVTQSGRGSASVSKEQASLYAAQLVQNGALFEATVHRMVLTGTASAALTFCSSGDTDGVCNTAAPADADEGLCETGSDCLFASSGGGFAITSLPPDAIDQDLANASIAYFTEVTDPMAPFVVMALIPLHRAVCNAINAALGLQDADTHALDTALQAQCYDGGGYYVYAHLIRL